MEQKPVDGWEVLEPPSVDIAQKYLDEADAVATRRERAVDRRALARLQIVNAVATAAYLAVITLVLRGDSALASQTILFSFLVWVQLASGIAQRSGMRRRFSWSRWPELLAGGLLVAVVLVVFCLAIWAPGFPAVGALIPSALVLFGLGGYGAVQLVRASGDVRPPRSHPRPLSRLARWGTILVGVAVGVLIMLASAPDGVLASVLVLLVVLVLATWMFAFSTDLGLPWIGASWRWPQLAVFGVAVSALASVVLLAIPIAGGALVGASVITLFVAVSFVPGRDLRD
ncbi:cation transporting ATPase C-terminal domain-containing protein [Microbacterium sp. APC 3901]|uniref:cation transporting ATPase C-terminal domain-containing protein n=1 Tax=Microbacterium sp. APC 3901 TaxID=3035192 RepID=UPI0025B43051|nr:cation transporting ATPase C-terminal domain-containing protein [Microbacterium sp. APC 3901]MDN3443345.1 hypothetical protein [Microbacterium sp. APC 3901]